MNATTTTNTTIKESKLNYATWVARELETRGYNVEVKEITKNNGVQLTGIQFNNGTGINPVLYIDDFYDRDVAALDAADEVASRYEKAKDAAPNIEYMDVFDDWNVAKNFVQPRLISKANNDVTGMPHKEFLDLYVIYAIQFNVETSTKITNQLLDKWGITLDELDKVARENIDPEMQSMAEMLAGMGFPLPEDDMPGVPMYVLTNTNKMYGAASLLKPEVFDRFDQDMYIIPSSIHECIIVPANDEMGMALGNMIKEVNATQVLPEEVLGEEPYFFDATTREVRLVA